MGLILPRLGRTDTDRQAGGEQFLTVEDSMGIINPSRGNLEPGAEQLRSDVAIICGLARAVLGRENPIDWEGLCGNYSRIRDHIERVISGFESFNQRIAQGPQWREPLRRFRRRRSGALHCYLLCAKCRATTYETAR
jgi:anaerobic selenocysteine-containing dehydrogenase